MDFVEVLLDFFFSNLLLQVVLFLSLFLCGLQLPLFSLGPVLLEIFRLGRFTMLHLLLLLISKSQVQRLQREIDLIHARIH